MILQKEKSKEEKSKELYSIIQTNIPLKDKNWFETGGPAEFFCEPKRAHEFQIALEFANKNNLEISILGEGANTLISDEGVKGLVIRAALNSIDLTEENN